MKLYCPECQTRYEGEDLEVCPEDGARLFVVESDDGEGDPLIGAVIDERFRIGDLLGAGGMGAVYRATQLSIQREVALKVLRSELGDEEVALERFYREAKVVSELSHPNIVRLVDFGQDRDRDLLYLVMELVRGMDLGDLVERGRLRTNLALEVVYQVCGALTEPHKRGIVHRDMKPENIIIVPVSDGTLQVKVLDFGIARVLEDEATKLTKTGMICGTPWYMAPEQAQNQELDGRTDIYALGVILFEMLTGQPPFEGETSLQVLLNHIQRPAPDLSVVAPVGMVPDEVSALVAEMMAKSPDGRPETARKLRDRIDALRRKLNLRPVRLDDEEEDPFEPWILPPLDVGEDQSSSALDSGGELPGGMGVMETGQMHGAGVETEEFAGGAARGESAVGVTEHQYAGVAHTAAARESVDDAAEPRRTTAEVTDGRATDEESGRSASIGRVEGDGDDAAVAKPAGSPDRETGQGDGDDEAVDSGRPMSLVLILSIVGIAVICSGGGVWLYFVAAEVAEEEVEEAIAEAEMEPDDEEVGEVEGDDELAEDETAVDEEGDVPVEQLEEVAETADGGDDPGVGAPETDEGEGQVDEPESVDEPTVVEDTSPPSVELAGGGAADESVDDPSTPEGDEAPEVDGPEDVDAAEDEPDESDEADEIDASQDEPREDDEPEDEERDALQERLDGLR